MDGLFPTSIPFDWGASRYWPGPPPSVTWVPPEKGKSLRAKVRLLAPKTPGVYGMVDRDGMLFYVGKAKNLRTRLLGYFRTGNDHKKERRIIRNVRGILWEPCPSEFTSLLRELELIRKWRPRLNVVGQPLRNQRAFFCLGRSPAPYAFVTRRLPRDSWSVFGPIPASYKARDAARKLNDLFKLRDCPQPQDMVFSDERGLFEIADGAGCIRLEISQCLGPCVASCTSRQYHKQAERARAFLRGDDLTELKKLEAEMLAAAERMEYERAKAIKDKITPLAWLVERLARVRKAQSEMSFIYPQAGANGERWWCLIHGARIVAVVNAPVNDATAQAARNAVSAAFFRTSLDGLLRHYEDADGMALVMSWFAKYPAEREKVLSPRKAMDACELAVGTGKRR